MNLELIVKIVLAILGVGIVCRILKFAFKFIKNHMAVGKNIDNSHVESGAIVNKIIGDNGIMNIGVDEQKVDEKIEIATENCVREIHSDTEPEGQKEGDYWTFDY